MNNIREPIKKTSIAKKKKIIKEGFNLICNKGYHNITCIDIAKASEVSTGIIYQYFHDKRDIFLEGVKNYANNIIFPMINIIDTENITKTNLKQTVSNIIDIYIKSHKISYTAHEELMSMSHQDKEISKIFQDKEMELTNKISNILISNNFPNTNIKEKVHIIIGIIDKYCHEVVYHKHNELNYTTMKEEILNIITNILLNS